MVVFYFGADHSWEELQTKGFHRRNTCILKALGNDQRITKVYNIRRTTASSWIEKFKIGNTNHKIQDVWYAPLIPTWMPVLKYLNSFIFKLSIRLQTKFYNEKRVVWCYWPMAYLEAKELGFTENLLFDADHNIIEDPNLEVKNRENVLRILSEISEKAQYIISGSRSMNDWFVNSGFSTPKLFRNGIETERFLNSQTPTSEKNFGIGYVGTLSRWIDVDILSKLIDRRPNYIFTIIGSDFKTDISEKIKNKPNVNWLGKQPADKVPSLIKKMQVGLSLYKKIPGMDGDSMKIYEYLAAGIPVISTPYHDHLSQDFNGLLNIADDLENILFHLDRIMSKKLATESVEVNKFLNDSHWEVRVSNFLTNSNINGN